MGFIVDKSSGNYIFIGSRDLFESLQEAMDQYADYIVKKHRKETNEVRKKRIKKNG
jgi:hypothetical protein